jgi:hypothetical protein
MEIGSTFLLPFAHFFTIVIGMGKIVAPVDPPCRLSWENATGMPRREPFINACCTLFLSVRLCRSRPVEKRGRGWGEP